MRLVSSDDVKKKSKTERRLLWNHEGVSGFNCPFSVDRSVVYTCQYGKPRKQSQSKKKRKTGGNTDHQYLRKRRFLIQNTKKVDCEAKLFVRYITRYSDYAVSPNVGRGARQVQLDSLQEGLRNGNIKTEKSIHLKLPLNGAHTNHTLSVESGFSKSMHAKLKELIFQHVQMGVTSVAYLKKLLKQYVVKELSHSDLKNPSETDRSYFPTNRDIYNCVHAALVAGRYSDLDQENLAKKFQLENPTIFISDQLQVNVVTLKT
ncbi:hypothetical protein ScPMuIL_008077 [Solemya velum]